MKKYIHIVTVTVKAPKGFSPRQTSIKGMVLSKRKAYRQKAEENVLDIVRKAYSEGGKAREFGLKFDVSAITVPISLIMIDEDIKDFRITSPAND